MLLGPLLGYERNQYYTVCFLAEPTLTAATLEFSSGTKVPFTTDAGATTPTGRFWRAEAPIPALAGQPQTLSYRINSAGSFLKDQHGRDTWSFRVPASDGAARVAYAACNGFSSPKLAASTAEPYIMWEKFAALHNAAPFDLLLMGGDQLYADEVLALPGIREWTEKSHEEMKAYVPSLQLKRRIDDFYDRLYQKRWADENMSLLLASIPSVMMWDDHDIVDGWGSHDDVPQGTPMYQEIYKAARKYFVMFQLRQPGAFANRSRLNPGAEHCALAFDLADFRVLAMDHRSERSISAVMSDQQHRDVKAWLAAQASTDGRTMLVLSGIPVVYRSFAALETAMEITPWTEEATDDVRDHWMASHHRGERTRLLNNLFTAPVERMWLLSGDVHVGALGAIHNGARSIYQIISTGIVHPAPTAMEWAGLRALTNDDPETIPGTAITTEMLTPNHGPRYIRDRNFVTLEHAADGKLWTKWICENPTSPLPPEFVA